MSVIERSVRISNLPDELDQEELKKLLYKAGQIEKLVICGDQAVATFSNTLECDNAQKLSGKALKHHEHERLHIVRLSQHEYNDLTSSGNCKEIPIFHAPEIIPSQEKEKEQIKIGQIDMQSGNLGANVEKQELIEDPEKIQQKEIMQK